MTAAPAVTPTAVAAVEYLRLDPPRLVASACLTCGARFFDRRVACAACGAESFGRVDVPTEGTLTSFTIVAVAGPDVEVPFISAIVDCGGTTVQANLVDVTPDPAEIHLNMRVRLTTRSLGLDAAGVEALAFAFEPVAGPAPDRSPAGSGGGS